MKTGLASQVGISLMCIIMTSFCTAWQANNAECCRNISSLQYTHAMQLQKLCQAIYPILISRAVGNPA